MRSHTFPSPITILQHGSSGFKEHVTSLRGTLSNSGHVSVGASPPPPSLGKSRFQASHRSESYSLLTANPVSSRGTPAAAAKEQGRGEAKPMTTASEPPPPLPKGSAQCPAMSSSAKRCRHHPAIAHRAASLFPLLSFSLDLYTLDIYILYSYILKKRRPVIDSPEGKNHTG